MALYGRLELSTDVKSLLVMVLLSLPLPAVAVRNKTIAELSARRAAPFSVQYLTVFPVAELMNRMVEVPAVEEVLLLVLIIVSDLVEPEALTRPSIVTLSEIGRASCRERA